MNTLLTPIAGPEGGLPPGGIGAPHAIRFTRGLPGFEACRSFVLMSPDDEGPLQCLKAIEGPAASFLVIDPRLVDPGYACELTEADRHMLRAGEDSALLWLALVIVDNDGTMSVNLRAPLVINPALMVGHQLIPHQSSYPLRHVLLGAE